MEEIELVEVMHRAVIKTRTLRPLPGEITVTRVNNAILPIHLETARKAIAACTTLPELLTYKDKVEGLAAAVRTMKHVGPEMIKAANEMMADAWRKGGELLSQYSNVFVPIPNTRGRGISDRLKVTRSLGLKRPEATDMVRVYKAPATQAYAAAQKSRNLGAVSRMMPIVHKHTGVTYSTALRSILGRAGLGLSPVLTSLRRLDLDQFQHLTPDERKVVKKKIVEIQELLDQMDQLCG